MHTDDDREAQPSKEPRERRHRGEKPRPSPSDSREPLNILADSPNLQLIRAFIEQVARRLGHGRWRVEEDAIDATLDKVIDRALDRTRPAPANWLRFAGSVYRNLVKSGPTRPVLDRVRTDALSQQHERLESVESGIEIQLTADSIPELFLEPFTEPERRAVLARIRFRPDAAAAAEAGMTVTALRTRFDRAVEKICRRNA
ncbi:MAG: hypothetical protein U1F36_11030 [Planctomycetota bacterium]